MNSRLLQVGFFGIMVALVVVLAVLRGGQNRPGPRARAAVSRTDVPQSNPAPSEPAARPEPHSPEGARKQGIALHDSTLSSLIENARMAEQRGDAATRDAMLAGLKRDREKSKELIANQMKTATDRSAVAALQSLLEKIQ